MKLVQHQKWFTRLCLFGLLLMLNGCSYSYWCELRCVIIDAVTKKPVPGVNLTVNLVGLKDRKDLDKVFDQLTDETGHGDQKLGVSLSSFDHGLPRWYLKIDKAGYVSEIVDVSPRGKPISYGNKSPMVVTVVVNLQPVK